MGQTTIKVSTTLRDRIAKDARERGETIGAFLTAVLDDRERRDRMAAVGAAFAGAVDEAYQEDLAAWDAIAAGLPS